MATAIDTSEVAALKRQIQKLQDENTRLKAQLYDKSRELSEVQERLTVAEQVTAATQRRELDEEGHSLELTTDHVYEKLRLDLEEEHIYTKLLPIVQKGCYQIQFCINETHQLTLQNSTLWLMLLASVCLWSLDDSPHSSDCDFVVLVRNNPCRPRTSTVFQHKHV